jgi:hypothetical protein
VTRGGQSKRLRDWNDRDDDVMRFLAQQWCADLTALQLACGLSRAQMYEQVAAWRDGFKTVCHEPVRQGGSGMSYPLVWLRPKLAEKYLGWRPSQPWSPARNNVTHMVTVARVRAALCGLEAECWTPERELMRAAAIAANRAAAFRIDGAARMVRARAPRGHVHDGRYRDPSGQWWAVEVELSRKWNNQRLADAVLSAWKALRPGDFLLYLYDDESVSRALIRVIEALSGSGRIDEDVAPVRVRRVDETIRLRTTDRDPGEATA